MVDIYLLFKGLNVKVEKGQTLALVGQSGCGKSTLIQLLQRFYDCNGGKVIIDDTVVSEFDLTKLRSQIGFVQQEPILFDKTIRGTILRA